MVKLSPAQAVVVDTLKSGGGLKSGQHGAWRTLEGFTFNVGMSTIRALLSKKLITRNEGPMSICTYTLTDVEVSE